MRAQKISVRRPCARVPLLCVHRERVPRSTQRRCVDNPLRHPSCLPLSCVCAHVLTHVVCACPVSLPLSSCARPSLRAQRQGCKTGLLLELDAGQNNTRALFCMRWRCWLRGIWVRGCGKVVVADAKCSQIRPKDVPCFVCAGCTAVLAVLAARKGAWLRQSDQARLII